MVSATPGNPTRALKKVGRAGESRGGEAAVCPEARKKELNSCGWQGRERWSSWGRGRKPRRRGGHPARRVCRGALFTGKNLAELETTGDAAAESRGGRRARRGTRPQLGGGSRQSCPPPPARAALRFSWLNWCI